MPNRIFAEPLAVNDNMGRLRIVSDTLGVAEMLLRRWPEKRREPSYREAVSRCLAAMEGRCAAREAHHAFLQAAMAANIYVGKNLRAYPPPIWSDEGDRSRCSDGTDPNARRTLLVHHVSPGLPDFSSPQARSRTRKK
jgi:hypothetical protein